MRVAHPRSCRNGARNCLGIFLSWLMRAALLPAVLLGILAPAASGDAGDSRKDSTILLTVHGAPGEWRDFPLGDATVISSFRQSFVSGSCLALTVTKHVDRTSGLFAAAATSRRSFPEITLLVRGSGGEPEALRIVYRNIVLTHVEHASGPDGVVEKLEFAPASRASVEVFRAGAPLTGRDDKDAHARPKVACSPEIAGVESAWVFDRPQARRILRPGW
jgi:hypothetical protein